MADPSSSGAVARDPIERWSRDAAHPPPGKATDAWQLAAEIARSWDEVAASALLTPYRALGIAVLNEERGFAFYSYVAAQAEDDTIRVAVEQLASEELRHAALLRRERRRAYRRERQAGATAAMPAAPTAHEFIQRACQLERRSAERPAAISERLAALGYVKDAVALATIADDERQAAAALGPATAEGTQARAAIADLEGCDRIELSRAGLAESERTYDTYADALDHAGTEPVLVLAQEGAGRAVRHLGLIAAKLYAPAT